ncbi:MAG: dethiobiotin synthase [Deltaproteobacteria bacterium]|nr:dethiobiotin synthase [Deltaproteobacteria bacterium]
MPETKSEKIADIYIVGTDTGVGKTVLSLLLMQFFEARSYRPFYLKPLQTGCQDAYDQDSDAAFVYRHVTSLINQDPADSVIYCFRNPKAPFFAARDEGQEIDLRRIDEIVAGKRHRHNPLILEAAGGLLVPVTEETLMVDIIKTSGARVLLAARAGLGTINHTLLSVEALRARDVEPAGIVFLDAVGTREDMIAENMEAVQRYSGIAVAGVIGKVHDFNHPSEECFSILKFLLQTKGISFT